MARLGCRCGLVAYAALRGGGLWLLVATAWADDDDEEKTPALPKEIAELARKYAGITEWKGFFDASTAGATTWGNPDHSINGFRQFEARSHGSFILKRSADGWNPKRGEFSWVIAKGEPGEAAGSEYDQFSLKESNRGQSEEWRREISGTVPMLMTEFSIILPKQFVHLHPGHASDDKQSKGTRIGQIISQGSSANGQRRLVTQPIEETFRGSIRYWMARTGAAQDKENAIQEWATVRNGPSVLTFTYQSVGTYPSGANSPECQHRSRVLLFPVYDDLEVEVTIDGYATWRPKGLIAKPAEPGNGLVARATLKSKTGKVKELPEVKRFTFELLDTSREPGVCLNWPLGAKDADYDLRLASESGGTLSDAEQKLLVSAALKDENARPYAEAKIDSYDFGGRATLQVICELEDGREIMGLIKTDSGADDLVRLPKMNGPDWIAENWRKEKKVEKLPALHDDEKVEGQKHNGDGFTLYEEYRGWAQNGKHLEGDPKAKDFFVLNQIGTASGGSDGPDGRAGIELFAQASKLRVHGKITPAEFDWRIRVMNANRRDGPHRVAQHGVFITDIPWKHGEVRAGKTTLSDELRSGRPATAVSIGILRKTDPHSVFTDKANKTANLSKSAAGSVYARAVAHELAHAVGAEHHGEGGDHAQTLYFQGAGDPSNPTGRARFVESSPRTNFEYGTRQVLGRPPVWSDFDRGATIHLYWEDNTREEIAELLAPEFESALEEERADPVWDRSAEAVRRASEYSRYGKDANFWGELALHTSVAEGATKAGWEKHHSAEGGSFAKFIYVADPQGLQSGNELCLMRYYFANAYPIKGRANAYYVIRTPSRIGNDLCRSPVGTGANDKDHEPQSRFGDCAHGRGNCFEQICPNDAIPAPKS